jgi:spore coat protein U-like protein
LTTAHLHRCDIVLKGHVVVEAVERSWERLVNGVLLEEAEAAGFELFVTAAKNIRCQQNLASRKIAIIALGNAQWPVLHRYVERVVAAVDDATPGSYTEVDVPFD